MFLGATEVIIVNEMAVSAPGVFSMSVLFCVYSRGVLNESVPPEVSPGCVGQSAVHCVHGSAHHLCPQ